MLSALLDAIYPERCASCSTLVEAGRPMCAPCAESLYPIDACCPRCGIPLEATVVCRSCDRRPPPFSSARAPFRYGGELAAVIVALKYRQRYDLVRPLATLVAPAFAEAAADRQLIVPVPQHWRRSLHRGFDHAAALATAFRRRARIDAPLAMRCIRRSRATPPQSGSSAAQRAANVRGAFAVTRRGMRALRGARVLVVDDVMTTGATAAAVSRALVAGGAADVRVFCVARADT